MNNGTKTALINAAIITAGVAVVYLTTWIMMRNTRFEPNTLSRWIELPFRPMRNFPTLGAVFLIFAYLSLIVVGIAFPKIRGLSFVASGAAMLIWLGATVNYLILGLIG